MSSREPPYDGAHESLTNPESGADPGLREIRRMPVETRPPGSSRRDSDDWLGGGDDWLDDAPPPQRRAPRRGESQSLDDDATLLDVRTPEEHAYDVTIRRRRLVGLLVAFAVVAAIVWLAVTAFGGGSSGTPTVPPAITPTTVEQPTTSTPASTTPVTPTTSTTTPTAPAAVELAAGEKLRRDSTGATVSQVQTALTTLGFDPGPVDGDYGPKTEAAVVAFQTSKGIAADGVVGVDTARELNAALASTG